MFNWFRKIPHFGYGKCGGAKRDCSPAKPKDWMDLAFKDHDDELEKAKNQEEIDTADNKLGRKLRKGDPKKLGVYGKIYRFLSMIIFKV